MELRVLKYFMVIAREKSFTKAANILHITQPTLSRQIKELEEELGKTFFIREHHQVVLTEEGLLMREYVSKILGLVNEVESKIGDHVYLRGNIRIACGEGESMRIVMKTIKKMRDLYPDVHFQIVSGNAQEVMRLLDNDLCDVGFVYDPVDLSRYDFMRLDKEENIGVWMRKDCSLVEYDFIYPQHLKDVPVILSSQDMIKNEVAGWIGGNDRKLNVVGTYNLIYNGLMMVEEGIGVMIGFKSLALNDQLCFKPLYPQMTTRLNIIYKKYQTFPDFIQYFIEMLKNECE